MGGRGAHLLPVFAIWAAAATALAIPVRRVVDWFVMTDELLYARLAFSVARTHSPWPTLHGQHVPIANFLYPLLLSSVVGNHLVPTFIVRGHTLNAILITSAAVPTYLLARATVRSRLGAYAASMLAVVVPWLVLASFLTTESAAYPAFIWAVYLLQRGVDRPSKANDGLAIAGLLLATVVRTQFAGLLVVAPLACLLHERSLRRALDRHRVLAIATAAGAAALLVLVAIGHASDVLGSYAATAHGSPVGTSTLRALEQHAGTLSIALGLLPALLGAAWLLGRAWANEPGPLVSTLAVAVVLVEVTSFDERFGGNLPRDRYLFYAAPLLLIGFVGALLDERLPRWSLILPGFLVLFGLMHAPLPTFQKLNVDTPAAILDDYLLRSGGGLNGARATLVISTLLLLGILVLARRLFPIRLVAVALIALTTAGLASETAYAFARLFRVDGTSGRPITLSQGGVFDWIDRTVGPNADVTIAPYAQLPQDYWATAAFWWNLEFWNRSVTHDAYIDGKFREIQTTFPPTNLTFETDTGRSNVSPTRYIAESDIESRFRMAGPIVTSARNVDLIDAGSAWRAAWLSFGLDDDGFTIPGKTATVRFYPEPRQTGPLTRYVTFHLVSAADDEGATLTSNQGTWTSQLTNGEDDLAVTVCVPANGYGKIELVPKGSTTVYGDLGTRAGMSESRVRGLMVGRISEADETTSVAHC